MKVWLFQYNLGHDGTMLKGIYSTKAKADHLRRGEIVELIREMKGKRDHPDELYPVVRAYVQDLADSLEIIEVEVDA